MERDNIIYIRRALSPLLLISLSLIRVGNVCFVIFIHNFPVKKRGERKRKRAREREIQKTHYAIIIFL